MKHPGTGVLCALCALFALFAVKKVPSSAEHRPVHVDSILPIEEEIRRFRAALPDSVEALAGGAGSLDALVARFVTALEEEDVATLAELRLTSAEFAYLYFPYTRYTRRPYELSPALVWFQFENYGSRGLGRALRRYGGRPLGYAGVVCPGAPRAEGPNRILEGCQVRSVQPAGDTLGLMLFGPILERGGQFKFVNYANRM